MTNGLEKAKKLTPTMESGLQKMAVKLRRQRETIAQPNDNTGRALEKRGLVEFVHEITGWRYYRITPLGLTALQQIEDQK